MHSLGCIYMGWTCQGKPGGLSRTQRNICHVVEHLRLCLKGFHQHGKGGCQECDVGFTWRGDAGKVRGGHTPAVEVTGGSHSPMTLSSVPHMCGRLFSDVRFFLSHT